MSAEVVSLAPSVRQDRRRTAAEIGRARRLVATLGGRFSIELGIDVDGGADEVERWALAATLFGNRISAGIVVRTYRELERAGSGRSRMQAGEAGRSSLPFSTEGAMPGTTSARRGGFWR